jgi:hypothetical protein
MAENNVNYFTAPAVKTRLVLRILPYAVLARLMN